MARIMLELLATMSSTALHSLIEFSLKSSMTASVKEMKPWTSSSACYTVQGEQGFAFNLINNKQLIMNAKFVPDARREEVTWLGSMGMIIRNSNYAGLNDTKLRFEAQEKTVYINDKVVLNAKNVERLTFSDGKMKISEAAPVAGFHYPSLLIDLKDVEVSFTIKYTNQHLDMFWHSTGKKVANSHGLIGKL